MKRPKIEPYLYLSGQSALILLILGYIVSDRYQAYVHEKKFGNIEHNREMVGIRSDRPADSLDYPVYMRTAFLKLESTFADPNSFRLVVCTKAHSQIKRRDSEAPRFC